MKLSGIFLFLFALAAFSSGTGLQQAMRVAGGRMCADGHRQTHFISNSFTLTDQGGETALAHVFELYPQGYLIISGDDGITPVIAYSYTDNCREQNALSSPLLELVEYDLSLRLQNLETSPEWRLNAEREEWNALMNGEIPADPLFEQWPPVGSTPTGGWLQENWTQGAPYNMYCPMDLIAGSRSVAGCPALVMGAILNFHEQTNGTRFSDGDDYYHNYHEYYWIDDDFVNHDFPSWVELNSLLDSLEAHYAAGTITSSDKAAIVYASGAACKQVYTASVSGTFGVDQAYDAYIRFGFTGCELLYDYSDSLYSRMAQNMIDAMPIHLAIIDEGPQYGHNVVVDGYNTDEFFHLNFGWGGSSNGWYSFPLTGMPYGMNIIEGVVLDIGEPLQAAGGGGDIIGDIQISSLTNPVSSALRAELWVPGTCTAQIAIYSLDGRLIQTVFLPLEAGANEFSVPAGELNAGVYVIRAESDAAQDTALFTVLD